MGVACVPGTLCWEVHDSAVPPKQKAREKPPETLPGSRLRGRPSHSVEGSHFLFFLLLRFLASLQRLNVTITRAKYSLFILGHLRTLRVSMA